MLQKHPDPLPVEVHTPNRISTRVRRSKLYIHLDRLFPPISFQTRRRMLGVGMAVLGVVVVTLLWRWGGGLYRPPTGAEGPGAFLPSVESDPTGVPSVPEPSDTLLDENQSEAESFPPSEGDGTTDLLPAPETEPSTECMTVSPDESDTEPSTECTTTFPDEPDTEPSTECMTTFPEESDTEPPRELETTPATEPLPPPLPDGCIPIISLNMSEPERGAGYIHNMGATLPTALPTDTPWRTASPAVLIVNTHPYEGYSDGSAWYDPTAGGLALTDTPNDPDGVVALGSSLARTLREMGVTVIHLRVAVTAGESTADIYDRTEAMIRYYCRLYPDIGLVIDLRRSAEMTAEGEILRTEGDRDGEICAQLRVSVSGGRDLASLGSDLAVALSLRESLWAVSPSLSRPVRVKSGKGLVSDLNHLRVLTLEMGSAGNTYDEAKGLVAPLGESIVHVLQKFS